MQQIQPYTPITINRLQDRQLQTVLPVLQQQQIPYQISQDQLGQYSLHTQGRALPIIQQIQQTTAGWDLFDRKPEHRSTGNDAMFAFITFAVVFTIINQSSLVAGWAAGAGLDGNFVRGVAIIGVGIATTLFWSELLLSHDNRRGMFKWPLIIIYFWAGMWFILTSFGWDMAGGLDRLLR